MSDNKQKPTAAKKEQDAPTNMELEPKDEKQIRRETINSALERLQGLLEDLEAQRRQDPPPKEDKR